MLRAKFHVVSNLLSVLKIAILMPLYPARALPFKMNVPENKTMVNLKSASFVIIMHLPEGFTHIQPQMNPWLHFGESFT